MPPPEHPLIDALYAGDQARIDALLARGHDPNEALPEGGTALILAAQNGDESLVRRLIAAGADPNRIARNGATALTAARGVKTLAAVMAGQPSFATCLHGIRSALILHVGDWSVACIAEAMPPAERDLARAGLDLVRHADRFHRDRLPALLATARSTEVVRRFGGLALIRGAGAHPADANSLDLPRRLLEIGADPNDQLWDRSPLRTAIELRHPDFVDLLLQHGADPNLPRPDGVTPLMIAAGSERWRDERLPPVKGKDHALAAILDRLLAAGADVNARTSAPTGDGPAGRTALHFCVNHFPWNARRLLDADADATIADASGWTALHLCRLASTGKRLLAAGADPLARTVTGDTPLDLARRARRTAMVNWLTTVTARRSP